MMATPETAPAAHDTAEEAARASEEASGKKGPKQKTIRVTVSKGRTVTHGVGGVSKVHGENAELVLPIDEAPQLIEAGFVRQIGSEDDGPKAVAPPKVRDDTK
jgi:hypothetical protein